MVQVDEGSKGQEDRGAGTNLVEKTKRGSYFPRIQKYRPWRRPEVEGGQGSELEDSIAIRVSNRDRSSMSSSSRNTRKKQGPTLSRGRLKAVGKETGRKR
jgi:hypothetical protein